MFKGSKLRKVSSLIILKFQHWSTWCNMKCLSNISKLLLQMRHQKMFKILVHLIIHVAVSCLFLTGLARVWLSLNASGWFNKSINTLRILVGTRLTSKASDTHICANKFSGKKFHKFFSTSLFESIPIHDGMHATSCWCFLRNLSMYDCLPKQVKVRCVIWYIHNPFAPST